MTDGDVVMRVVVGRDPDGPAQVDLHAYLWPNDRREWSDGATQIRVTALASQDEATALEAARGFSLGSGRSVARSGPARLHLARRPRPSPRRPRRLHLARRRCLSRRPSPRRRRRPYPTREAGVTVTTGVLPPPVRPADAETAPGQPSDQGGGAASR